MRKVMTVALVAGAVLWQAGTLRAVELHYPASASAPAVTSAGAVHADAEKAAAEVDRPSHEREHSWRGVLAGVGGCACVGVAGAAFLVAMYFVVKSAVRKGMLEAGKKTGEPPKTA